MEIQNAAQNPINPLGLLGANYSGTQGATGGETAVVNGGAAPISSGDTSTISNEALRMSSADSQPVALMAIANPSTPAVVTGSDFDPVTFTGTSASAKIGIDKVGFNNTTGAVSWGGAALNLTGLWDSKADNLVIQKAGSYLNVFKTDSAGAVTESFRLTLEGAQVKDSAGDVLAATTTRLCLQTI